MNFGSRNGQAIILVVVAASLLLIGVLGYAIDGGQMYAQRQMAQAAADAAAEAGIMSIMRGTNATSTYTFGTGEASYTCTTTDGRTPCVYARNNGFGGTASDTVTLSYPSSVAGVGSVTVPAFQVTVQRTLNTGFVQFLKGPATTTITAKAIAGIVGAVSPDSIIVLGSGTAFTANNGASVTVGGAIAINSASNPPANISGGATVTASAINVVSTTASSSHINNGGSTNPTPVTGVAAVADPLASLAAPTPGACLQTSMYNVPSNTVIPAGNYCGGITVSNGVTGVTFGSGIYTITGGGLTFGGGITTSGSGVMFYLTGTNATYGSATIANGVTVTFSAPTSGPYTGILFYQNRAITSSNNATFAGGANMDLTGTLYFPTTDVSYSNGTTGAGSTTAIVANQVSFAGGAKISYDSTGSKTGLSNKSAAVIQ